MVFLLLRSRQTVRRREQRVPSAAHHGRIAPVILFLRLKVMNMTKDQEWLLQRDLQEIEERDNLEDE